MRATSIRRLAGGVAGLLLVGATLLSTGSALAGETREVTIATTTPTPVTAGGVTRTDITITNVSGHTLSNAHFLINLDMARPLPSDVAIVAVFGPNSAACPTITDPVTTLDCAFGNIGSKPSQRTRQLSVAFSVGAEGAHGIDVEVKVAETGSDVGSNTNFRTATISVDAGEATCHNLATFLPPGVAKTLSPADASSCVNPAQKSGLVVPAAASGNLVLLNDSATATNCPTSFTCLGNVVSATVNDGSPISPYLVWRIFYSNATLGNVNPNKVAFIHDTTIIPAGNKGLCKNATSINCQDPYETSSTGVTFIVRTPTNGLIKGMH
jgi:hypothetical protein